MSTKNSRQREVSIKARHEFQWAGASNGSKKDVSLDITSAVCLLLRQQNKMDGWIKLLDLNINMGLCSTLLILFYLCFFTLSSTFMSFSFL